MARYPEAIWRPTNKHGYPGNDTHLHQGLVIHSAEGSLAGLFSVLDGTREASWHFSVTQGGSVYQHVDTDRIAWTNGSLLANQKFWGIECEGGGLGSPGEPLTEPQYQALAGVVWWLWKVHGLTRYERQRTLWEHNEMTRFEAPPTTCPSGRIPWSRLIAESEDDMTPEEVREIIHAETATLRGEAAALRVEVNQLNQTLKGVIRSVKNRNKLIYAGSDPDSREVARNVAKLEA